MCRSSHPRSFVAGLFAIAVLLLAGFSRAASAAPSLYDNFSENSQASFWYSIAGDSAETLTDTGGLLQFTSTAASTGWGCNYLLRETEIEANQNFEVKATWHLAAMSGLQNNQEVCVGLQLMPNTGLNGNDVEIRTRWQNNSGSSASQDFDTRVETNNNRIDQDQLSPSSNVTDGTFYISYNASTDTLYVSINGYFLPASSNGDWVYPGVVYGQWGASRIVVMLEAEAQQVAVTSGQANFSYFEVTEGTMVTPPTVTGTVNSLVNGAAGTVAVTFSGPTPDVNGKTAGSYATPFSVKLDQGFPIFATAPATDGSGNNFTCWQVDGVPYTADATAQLWLAENHTFTAVYGGAGALFTDSLSGAAIGPWWYQVQQNSAQVYVQEQTQGLELLSNATATGQIAGLMLRQRRLDLKNSSGFQLQVDWHCTVASGTTELGLMLYGQEGQDENVGICVAYDPTDGAIFGVTGAGSNEGGTFLSGNLARTATSGTLYVSYDNNNQILYLSKNGYGPFVNNPANGDWAVSNGNANFYGFNSNYLIVALGGIANGVAISPGSAYLDNFIIKKGWFDTPTTGQIQVTTSLGSTGVPLYFSPADDSGAGNGTTPFYRTVENDIPIYLIAPSTASGDNFVQWEENGSECSSSAAIAPPAFTNSNPNYGALYETPASTVTLSVKSTPATGIAITSSTGHGGTTNYTLSSVPLTTTVNLVAPATAGANSFLYWLVNGSEYGTDTSLTDSLMSNATCTAVYGSAASGSVTVTLNPAAAVTAGALWQEDEDNNTWWSGGATVGLSPGPHVVTFNTLPGWTSPAAQVVTITSGENTPVSATYTKNTCTLTVQSSPPTGIAITSSTGDGGTTNYTVSSIPYGTGNVNLVAPATDPTGYTFSQWMLDGKRQPFGQKSITFPMTADATAVALYDTANSFTLDVQSTPPAGIGITSSTGQGGTTEYFAPNIASGASVNLQAPATDPTGYIFSQWTVNGTAQAAGQKSITFTMAAGTAAVAQYTLPTYTLTVQSTPATGVSITGSTYNGTTNYTVTGIQYGTTVYLNAPSTDTIGDAFVQWSVNGEGYGTGNSSIQFTVDGATTAVAQYTGIIYVNRNATGANNGTSWTNAFVLLQSALNEAVAGDQVWVAAGTYAPTYDYGLGIGAQGMHFEMINGVSIYGGFAGTETLLSQRNWTTNITTLTGQGNCYHVFYHDTSYNGLSLNSTAVLDGFTITGGNANASADTLSHPETGGGMCNYSCSPNIANCTFSGNSAGYGGGMYNTSCSTTVANCTFSGNSATSNGGGMDNDCWSASNITNCTFSGNSASNSGGGMENSSVDPGIWPTITNCAFIGNSAAGGGGMDNDGFVAIVTNCTFSGNSAYIGGGMSHFGDSAIVTNCTFSGNSATEGDGGGMWSYYYASPTITNCTFSGNTASGYGGGMSNDDYSSPTVTNCILWGDSASITTAEVYNNTYTATFSYSDIAGCGGSGAGWIASIGTDGGDNIASDPLFVTAVPASSAPTTAGNYRLQAGSPCIATGNTAAVPPGVTTDLDGNPRIVGGAVDMGAYEHQGPAALTVQSTPLTGIAITSDTGDRKSVV